MTSSQKPPSSPPPQTYEQKHKEKLAHQLRENLKRRKQQARAQQNLPEKIAQTTPAPSSQAFALSSQKQAVGQGVLRTDDPLLVQGKGTYTADVTRDNQLFMVVVRSREAHGWLRSVDTEAARASPGVHAIFTGKDMQEAGYGFISCKIPLTSRDGSLVKKTHRSILALEKVSYVGDPIALVVAETYAQALNAAEALQIEIEPLEAVTDPIHAVQEGAPQLFEDIPHNIVLDYHFGDSAAVEAAFARAFHITRLSLPMTRVIANPLEPRAALAEFDADTERFTLHAPTQGVMGSRAALAEIMHIPPEKIHFLCQNVGGSFGMKAPVFPEYVGALHAAKMLKRPIKWVDTRSESFVSDFHGRDQIFDGELALDQEGHFLAFRFKGFANLGAYVVPIAALIPTFNLLKHLSACYQTPLLELSTQCVLTNTSPIAPYRGAGRPEGNYYTERLIEKAAQEMGVEAIELRRRNLIQPQQMPYHAASGCLYDSGNFPAILEKALELSEWNNYAVRQEASQQRGKIRGRGLAQFLEVTAPIMTESGSIHFEENGRISLLTGSHDQGQGHRTAFAQIVADQLGLPFDLFDVIQTDSDRLTTGSGTGGSKSLMNSGTALYQASQRVIEKGKIFVAHRLNLSPSQITFSQGVFSAETTNHTFHLLEIGVDLQKTSEKPEKLPFSSLNVDEVTTPAPSTYPNGCHICEIELDPETGIIQVERYTMVGDFGTLINPMIVEGQLQGGILQGLGQCLMEQAVYNEEGQLVTGSFMDYAMPRAQDAPVFLNYFLSTPAQTNPLGVKGCGEAGCAGSLPCIMNAVMDALSYYHIQDFDLPATPSRVWQVLREKGSF